MAGHYGTEYEVVIGKAKAKSLLSQLNREVPKIGYEIELAFVDRNPLHIMNICGQLYVASHSVKVENWKSVFNFDPVTLDFTALAS